MLRPQLALAPLVLLAAACAPTEDDPTLSDRLSTGFADAGIAVAGVRQGDIMTVYVCGGEQNYGTATRWFHALAVSEDGVIDGQSDGWSIHGELDDGGLTGTLRDDTGLDHPYSLSPTKIDSIAGLYTATTDGCTTGVIVWESGTDEATGELGYDAQGTWCNMASEFEQVIILEPIALTDMGIQASVDRTDVDDFFVTEF